MTSETVEAVKTNTEGSSTPLIDINSIYYLHPSDYIRHLHVNNVLNDNNYSDWAQEMKNFLFSKNKFCFVDGIAKLPNDNSADLMPWKRCDAMVKGWLTTAMDKEIRNSVKYADTAKEIWRDLEERFEKESAPRAYKLKKTLSVTRQDKASVSAYYTKLCGVWDEMQTISPLLKCSCSNCTCGIGKKMMEAKENERLYEFLMGLDEGFGTIKIQILAMKTIPSLGTTYHLVAQDKQQREISAA